MVTASPPSASAKPQRVGDAIALLFRQLQGAPGLDGQGDERCMQPVGQPLGVAHQPGRADVLVDADKNALARGPRPRNGAGLHLDEQLLVDPIGGAAQGQFAQRGQVGRREEVLQRPFRLLRHVDLAVLQPLDEIVRRKVDQLDRVGTIEHGVGQRLPDPHVGDLRHHIVEAFDVLDVDRRVDVDALAQDLFDVEISLRMTAARRVGVRELVDEHDLRPSCDDRVDVHFVERLPAIGDASPRNDLEALEQRLGLLAPVRLDDADDDVVAVLAARPGLLQHFVGLADTGRRADENLQLADAPLLTPRRLEQRVGRRPVVKVASLVGHPAEQSPHGPIEGVSAASLSSARFSASTFTRGSPSRSGEPAFGMLLRPAAATGPPEMLRAFATRGTWKSALSGEICGSRPLADVVTRSIGTDADAILGLRLVDVSLDPLDQGLAGRAEIRAHRVRRIVGRAVVLVESGGSGPVVADGRPWKYLSSVKAWPISAEPITLPSFSIRLPCAWLGKMTPAMPVIASG